MKVSKEMLALKVLERHFPPHLLMDFYKTVHKFHYPKGTEVVFSTWTPRKSRIEGIDKVVAFGFQAFIQEYLIDYFNLYFFMRDEDEVMEEYDRVMKYALGDDSYDSSHIRDLHRLGYLPIKICAVDEGTEVPIRVPMLTIENTIPKFFWVTNWLETLMSSELWMASTSATKAKKYKDILTYWADMTGDPSFVKFQGHDFSMRGMSDIHSGAKSGCAHLLSFVGTDTITSLKWAENYYETNIEKELVGTSIPATEHSVMCAHGKDLEFETYTYLIDNVHPTGPLSIVSDTWDLWSVLDNIIGPNVDKIKSRDGKVVIRPDSGDPVDIICGKKVKIFKTMDDAQNYYVEPADFEIGEIIKINKNWYKIQYINFGNMEVFFKEYDPSPEDKGVVEILWEKFGGTINEKGFKVLDPHIGVIYGDAITLERAKSICTRLFHKGFASTNVVFGIGSYTYQYNTRDTFGFALKATYVVVNGEERLIWKDPITDDGEKTSAKGLVAVLKNKDGSISYKDNLSRKEKDELKDVDLLKPIFIDGKFVSDKVTLKQIRERLGFII